MADALLPQNGAEQSSAAQDDVKPPSDGMDTNDPSSELRLIDECATDASISLSSEAHGAI